MKFKAPLVMEAIFILIAFLVYAITSNPFFIFNFIYIGTAIAAGVFLMSNNYKYGRNIIMLVVGSYLLFYVSILGHESLSLSGFWYYLFLGVFEAAVIHFLVAKIVGPFIFGRGWCGYACWTAMVLDLLPYRTPDHERKNWGYVRYLLFAAVLLYVLALFALRINNLDEIIFYTFIAGNVVYYISGISLAFHLKDNRAFCKYVCPITVFLKLSSYYSILRIKVNNDKCNECGKCVKKCPMDVEILNNSRKRENGTECILCLNCVNNCPNDALKI